MHPVGGEHADELHAVADPDHAAVVAQQVGQRLLEGAVEVDRGTELAGAHAVHRLEVLAPQGYDAQSPQALLGTHEVGDELVGGLAEQVQVSSAIGAFLVGLALTGQVRDRAEALIGPLRDLFAATFFLFFSFQIEPATVADALLPAAGLTVVTIATKLVSGRVSAGRAGVGPAGRRRAGTALIARGEFSIVIASLGVGLADGSELGGLAAAYVLLTAIVGPLAAKYSDSLALPWVGRRVLSSAR